MRVEPTTIVLRVGIVLGLVLGSATAWADKSSEPVVTLDSGSTVQLCADCSPRQIRLAVTPKSGYRVKKAKADQENPKVIEASFGNVRDASLAGQFTPTWELTKSGTPAALLIGVSEKIRKAGNYDLILSLQPDTAPSAPRLKLQIVHPAGKLELPEKLLVNRTEYWPFYTTIDRMDLDFRESTGVSEVIDVSVEARASTQGVDMVTGGLAIDSSPLAPSANSSVTNRSTGPTRKLFVAAGKTRELNYGLAGDFPLGVVTGSVRFFAPELTDPATLNFEVHSKLTKWYMLIAIVLGLFLSWYLKVYLHNRIELGEAVSKATTLLDRVQTDWNSHHDQTFRDALSQRIDELKAAIEDHDAAALAEPITTLDEAWRTALQDYATRSQAAQTALDEFRRVTDTAWILPPCALAVIADAKQARGEEPDISHIQQQLAQKDARSANEAIAQLRRRFGEKLRTCATNWHVNTLQYLRQVAEARAGIPTRILTQFGESLGKSDQQLNRMNSDQLVPDPATSIIIQCLRDFEGEYRAAGELLRELGLRLDEEWTEFTKVLDPSTATPASGTQLTQLRKSLTEFGDRLRQAASDPEAALSHLQTDLTGLQQAWHAGILEQLESLPDPKPDVNDLVLHQDFIGAAQQIAAERAKAQPNVVLKEGELESQAPSPAWPELAGFFPASSLSIISSSPQIVGIPNPFFGLHLQSKQEVQKAKLLQTLIVGILIIVWAFTSYSKTYGGTWSDISTIFFAAFAIDVTIDAMLSKLGAKSA